MPDPTILLVEDNPWDAELALRILRRLGMGEDTLILRDGKAALDYLFEVVRADGTLPRLILLDLKLPEATGLQVLQWIRANPKTSEIPVAILTGYEEDHQVVDIYKLGVSAYITKPLHEPELAALLSKLSISTPADS